jgi:hypothetical protein
MSAALLALKKAVHAALREDAAFVALAGGERIFDHPPPAAKLPHVAFGYASVLDSATATEEGSEILLTLDVWSRAQGSAEALAIAGRVAAVLHDAPLVPEGYHLVNIRLVSEEVSFEEDAAAHHAALLFRAVVEAAG